MFPYLEKRKLSYSWKLIIQHSVLLFDNFKAQCTGHLLKLLDSKNIDVIIKTHDSELRGQEEAGCMRRTSELFTHSTL